MSDQNSLRLPLTAIVASRNEAQLLARCLPTIQFCDEILVADLESDDETAQVAKEHGATVIRHPPVPTIERVRAQLADRARNDWLLFTDPDEEVPEALAAAVAELLPAVDPDVALVYGPIRYYLGSRPLQGTVWGGPHWRRFLVRRDAVEITPVIYSGTRVRDGYRTLELPFTDDTAIVHHWSSGYRELLAKHRRYLRVAGEDRWRSGETTGYRAIVRTPWRAFRESFFSKKGYRDGLTGLLLSIFWAWYATSAEIALKRRLQRGAAD